MRIFKLALVASSIVAPSVANAAVVASLGRNAALPSVSLSSAGLAGGAVATLSGGSVYNTDLPFADIPKGGVFGNNFLAVGPTAGQPATLTFTSPLSYLSFLWGSPDTYNVLTLTTNQGTYIYTATGLNFAVTDGNQSVSQYVQFAASAGETISRIAFTNSAQLDAFETANYSITAVPEPGVWAMLIVGFGMIGAAARYRRARPRVVFG